MASDFAANAIAVIKAAISSLLIVCIASTCARRVFFFLFVFDRANITIIMKHSHSCQNERVIIIRSVTIALSSNSS